MAGDRKANEVGLFHVLDLTEQTSVPDALFFLSFQKFLKCTSAGVQNMLIEPFNPPKMLPLSNKVV